MITCFDLDVSLFKEANLQRQFAKLAHLNNLSNDGRRKGRDGYPLLGVSIEIRISGSILP